MGACTNKDLTGMDLMRMPDAFRPAGTGAVAHSQQLSSVVTCNCNELVCLHVSYVSPMSFTLRLLQATQTHIFTCAFLCAFAGAHYLKRRAWPQYLPHGSAFLAFLEML